MGRGSGDQRDLAQWSWAPWQKFLLVVACSVVLWAVIISAAVSIV